MSTKPHIIVNKTHDFYDCKVVVEGKTVLETKLSLNEDSTHSKPEFLLATGIQPTNNDRILNAVKVIYDEIKQKIK